jgi:hypothetical protein
MTSKAVLKRIQNLVWVYIYGGLLAIVLASFLGSGDAATAWWLRAIGGAFVAVGIVLIYVRSRLTLTDPTPKDPA